jgi:hypothetical protein
MHALNLNVELWATPTLMRINGLKPVEKLDAMLCKLFIGEVDSRRKVFVKVGDCLWAVQEIVPVQLEIVKEGLERLWQ